MFRGPFYLQWDAQQERLRARQLMSQGTKQKSQHTIEHKGVEELQGIIVGLVRSFNDEVVVAFKNEKGELSLWTASLRAKSIAWTFPVNGSIGGNKDDSLGKENISKSFQHIVLAIEKFVPNSNVKVYFHPSNLGGLP